MRRIETMMNDAPLFRRATRLIVAPLFRRATYKRLYRTLIQENDKRLVIDWDCTNAWDTPRGGCGPEGHSTVNDQKINCRSLIQESDYKRLIHSLIQESEAIGCCSLIQESNLQEAFSLPYSGERVKSGHRMGL